MKRHIEKHFSARIGWLRAAVLGANDGIVSTASLVMGVAAADVAPGEVLIAGIAALVAGAMSMAAGEYVSVSSQADTEKADLDRERRELAASPEAEWRELMQIYRGRGLDEDLASEVATQLMQYDALGAHARDELGLTALHSARPIQAALASAATFTTGATVPLLALLVAPSTAIMPAVAGTSLLCLSMLGYLAAYAGGANPAIAVARVTLWGALAIAVTTTIGALFGSVV